VRLSLSLLMVALVVFTACGSETEAGLAPDETTTARADQNGEAPANEPSSDALEGTPIFEGLSQLALRGPASSNAGAAPQFAWEAVDGAATYEVAVTGPNGPIWAWSGNETAVWLGGLPFERPPGVGGPILEASSCWSVVARDSEGHAVAISPLVSVSPDGEEGSC